MSGRKMSYLFAVAGVVIFLASLALGYLGVGDRRIGAIQYLGMLVGVFLLIVGILAGTYLQDKQIDFHEVLRSGVDRIASLPAGVWIMVGFLIVYIFFFLQPVFLNSERDMFYFNKFLPDKKPIGLDIRAVMDYIRNWLAAGQSPYADGFIAYPPLSLVLFSPLLLIDYPGYYYFITSATLVFFLVSTLLIPWNRAGGMNKYLPVFLFVLGLFSYGFQFELERGQSNIIAFSLCLIAVHLFHLHQRHRLPAYLLFTLGVQIKIYPAILLLLFVENWWDWKSNVKRIGGILAVNFALLFISGPKIFADFLQAVRGQQAYGPTWNGNHSLSGFVNQLAWDGSGIFGTDAITFFQDNFRLVESLLLAVIGLCLFGVFLRSQTRKASGLDPNLLVLCTICGMVIPSISNDYKLPILIAPMAVFWSNLSVPEGGVEKKFLYFLLILTTSLAYWSMQYPFVVKPYFLARNFPALVVLLLAVTAMSFISSPKMDDAESPVNSKIMQTNE